MALLHHYVEAAQLLIKILEVNNPWKPRDLKIKAKKLGIFNKFTCTLSTSSSSSSSTPKETHLANHLYNLTELAEGCLKAIGDNATRDAIKAYFVEIQRTIKTVRSLFENSPVAMDLDLLLKSLYTDSKRTNRVFDDQTADFFLTSLKTIEGFSLDESNLTPVNILLITTQFNSLMLVLFQKFFSIIVSFLHNYIGSTTSPTVIQATTTLIQSANRPGLSARENTAAKKMRVSAKPFTPLPAISESTTVPLLPMVLAQPPLPPAPPLPPRLSSAAKPFIPTSH